MNDGDCHHLFVYGTLMSTATGALGARMRSRLRREAKILGPATMSGRLVDLGRYPAMTAAATGTDIVHGELLRLADPKRTLPWLDDYEGIGHGGQALNEYRRQVVAAWPDGGEQVDAWVYLFNRPVDGLVPIAGGRWQARP